MSADNPSLRTVAVLRPDLETSLRALIADPRFIYCPQAQKQTACAEVKLMHAGHDAWTRQFGKAKIKVDRVESTLGEARQSLDGCVVPQEGLSSTNLVPELVALPVDALFGFNGSSVESITSEGRERLDRLIADVKGDGALSSITVSGFTDRLGSEGYNRRLSHERAEIVRRYLESGGVTAAMEARGYGRASPGTDCRMRDRRALVACLANDRRVELRFSHKEDQG